jgi:hypothetical protein
MSRNSVLGSDVKIPEGRNSIEDFQIYDRLGWNIQFRTARRLSTIPIAANQMPYI